MSLMLLQFYVITETAVDLPSSRSEAGLSPTVNELWICDRFSAALSCAPLGHFFCLCLLQIWPSFQIMRGLSSKAFMELVL